MLEAEPYLQGEEDQNEGVKQELGLKKMLFKYEHENEQLRAQIKALTERLADITSKKEETLSPSPPSSPEKQNEYRLSLLKQEMRGLYAQIERVSNEVRGHKEKINEFQQLRCVELTNQIKKEDLEIKAFREQMAKNEQLKQFKGFASQAATLEQSSLRINQHSQKLKLLEEDLEKTRKSIRQMERYRDQHERSELKRHSYVVTINSQARRLGKPGTETLQPEEPKGKGLWHLEYSSQNYQKVRQQLELLRQEKQRIIDSLKNENQLLKDRFAELSLTAEHLNKSVHLPDIEPPRVKKSNPANTKALQLSSSLTGSRVHSPPRLLNVGPREFERSDDKNYKPKKLRKVEWQSANHRTTGIEWNDAHLRSPITGLNLWFDGSLVGLQVLQRMGESSQHLHLMGKGVSPVQYRLSGNDYLCNVVLWISDNKIVGIELLSHNGRQDGFGSRGKGRKFDFLIKDPEKPVFSYGRFRVFNNASEITKLGFEVV